MTIRQDPSSGEPDRRFVAICLVLAAAGGFADASSYVLVGSFTGHITGNSLLATIAVADHHWSQAVACVVAVAFFLLGTGGGAAWPLAADTAPARKLIGPLLIEMVLIVAGILAGMLRTPLGEDSFLACVCLALGIQNGVIGKLGSISVHTTFITGMSTSLIIAIVTGKPDLKRQLLPPVIGCFLLGALFGAFSSTYVGIAGLSGLMMPMAVALLLAATASP